MKPDSPPLAATQGWQQPLFVVVFCIMLLSLATNRLQAASSMNTTVSTELQSPLSVDEVISEYAHGLFLHMKGDYSGAIESFRRVMTAKPDEPAIKYSISKSYSHLAAADSARVYGEAAVRLDPANRYYLLYLAALSHELHDYERAADLYGQISRNGPVRVEDIYRQGVEYLSANRPYRALEVFRSALAIEPNNGAVLTQVLLLEITLNQYTAAIDTVSKLLALRGSDRKLGLTLAELYIKTGKRELAVQTIRELIDADPSDTSGWASLFDQAIRYGEPSEFSRELQAWLAHKPLPPVKLHDMARLFISRSGKESLYLKPTTMLFDTIIAMWPRDPQLRILKGMFEMTQGKREGLDSFGHAIRLDAKNVTAWEALITARFDLNETQRAFRLLAKARKELPQHRLRWQQLEGYMLLHSGSPKKAVVVLEKVVASRQKGVEERLLIRANLDLALACDMLGKKVRSRELYGKVLELDAHNTVAMNNLAYMLAEEGIMLRKAFGLASNAVMLEPDNGVYLDTLGWVYYKLGNYESARIVLERALTTGIDEAEIYQHLGKVYRMLGNEEKAKEMQEKSKRPPAR